LAKKLDVGFQDVNGVLVCFSLSEKLLYDPL